MKKRISRIAIIAVITLIEFQIIGWLAVRWEIHSNSKAEEFLKFAFQDHGTLAADEVVNYTEHHYLNYTINPRVSYLGTEQYNSQFLIRRTEPILDRDTVSWRGLVLGGSTTFGMGIPKEKDTWVWQVERSMRDLRGDRVDLINGGIGGYTIEENIIHYLTLLTQLNPDYVLLHVGLNDVHPRLFGKIQADYSNYRKPWRSDGQAFEPPIAWLAPFYLYRFYYVRTHLALGLDIATATAYRYPPSSEWLAALSRNSSEIFETNLRNLVALILAQGRKVAIVPQFFSPMTPDDEIFAKGVAEHNLVSKKVALDFKIPYLEEVLQPNQFKKEDLFDSCHLNEHGSKKFADVIYAFLANEELTQTHPGYAQTQ